MADTLNKHLELFLDKEILVVVNDGTTVQGVMTMLGTDYIGFNIAYVEHYSNNTIKPKYDHWMIPISSIQGIGCP